MTSTNLAAAFAGVPLVAQAQVESPVGPLTLLATARGLAGLWFDAQKYHPGELDAPVDAKQMHIAAAIAWLGAYWSKRDTASKKVALDLHGTPFQRAVWKALLEIPHGGTRSYGEIAARAGKADAARAAGAAIGRNPVGIIVPCHRVIGRDGSLTGYAGGLERKLALLQLEGALLT